MPRRRHIPHPCPSFCLLFHLFWPLFFCLRRVDTLLALSFLGETRFLAIDGEDLAGTEIPGFASNEQTLACGNVIGNQIVQVRRPPTLRQ